MDALILLSVAMAASAPEDDCHKPKPHVVHHVAHAASAASTPHHFFIKKKPVEDDCGSIKPLSMQPYLPLEEIPLMSFEEISRVDYSPAPFVGFLPLMGCMCSLCNRARETAFRPPIPVAVRMRGPIYTGGGGGYVPWVPLPVNEPSNLAFLGLGLILLIRRSLMK